MTSDPTSLVRAVWSSVTAAGDLFAERFYVRLFEIDESAARLFSTVDMDAQRRKLVRTLGVVVASLEDPDRLLSAVGPLGRRHAGYGVEDHHFDSVGEALLAALQDVLEDDFTPDVRSAWIEAYALVASVMRRGMARASRAELVE